jgi:hypothetical protein
VRRWADAAPAPAGDAAAGPAASHSAETAVTIASPTLAFTSINDLHNIFSIYLSIKATIRPRYQCAREYSRIRRMRDFADFCPFWGTGGAAGSAMLSRRPPRFSDYGTELLGTCLARCWFLAKSGFIPPGSAAICETSREFGPAESSRRYRGNEITCRLPNIGRFSAREMASA